MKKPLAGNHILITGASQGIGQAIARELMDQGARVAVHYNTNEAAARETIADYPESQSFVLRANLEHPEEVRGLFEQCIMQLGHLDTVIVNAGVFLPHPVSEGLDSWWEIWQKTLRINLDAAGLLTYLGIRHFRETGRGRFIYLGSRASFRGETQEYLAYAASKGGLTSLARTVARSFGKDRITSFIIAPGFTRTAMAESFIASHGERALLDEIALPELTRPGDIAPLTAFICTGKMDHATGTVIDVNAGSYLH
ncbi:SDR family NAD(P)-dependent oxidoreductase [Robiginitalea marina]|uniref:SDR family oxidoreductase n=1 Tax=Robiginitalea marina TaxID=2954105 RepID=A0ABT1AUH1_9FLAO|nr:SDR family oxidoreductase [Robiginitalea marina]MCO5723521.1 SDR family oxidoreductase [Robiginitalea marina]